MNQSTGRGFHGFLPVLPTPIQETPSALDAEGPIESHESGPCTFLVAGTRGYCYGVDRALRLADETIERFPDRRVILTSPILHNPHIHDHLVRRGARFLDREPELWDDLGSNDVVMIPAFGVAPSVRQRAESTGALVVDTTCGSVVFVWKHVEKLSADGFTLVYHGRRGHEEAVATLSRLESPTGRENPPYVIVENLGKAEFLTSYLRGEISRPILESALRGAFSAGFRFDGDIERIGFANQTTMLASESADIASLFARVQSERFSEFPPDRHFRAQDTICRATDERQDALHSVLEAKPDLLLIVGGFDSSNTSHLAEIASMAGFDAYHVEDAEDIRSASRIRHRDPHSSKVIESTDWLPRGRRLRIGASCGASTPEASLQLVLDRVADLATARGASA